MRHINLTVGPSVNFHHASKDLLAFLDGGKSRHGGSSRIGPMCRERNQHHVTRRITTAAVIGLETA